MLLALVVAKVAGVIVAILNESVVTRMPYIGFERDPVPNTACAVVEVAICNGQRGVVVPMPTYSAEFG